MQYIKRDRWYMKDDTVVHDKDYSMAIHVAACWAKKTWFSYLEDLECTSLFFPSVVAMLEFHWTYFPKCPALENNLPSNKLSHISHSYLSGPYRRSTHQSCCMKKNVLKQVAANFTGKHLCQSLFFNKVAGLRLKKRLWHRHFPVNFVKFLRKTFLQNTSRWLLLNLNTDITRWTWLT